MSSANPSQHTAENQKQQTNHAGQDAIAAEPSPKNQTEPAAANNPTSSPDQHAINEALIANWTRRLGIFTGLLVGVTVLLVIATGISAYFLWDSDHAIEGQLAVMQLAQRAWVAPNVVKWANTSVSNPLIVHFNIKNFGHEPARQVRNWQNWNAQISPQGNPITWRDINAWKSSQFDARTICGNVPGGRGSLMVPGVETPTGFDFVPGPLEAVQKALPYLQNNSDFLLYLGAMSMKRSAKRDIQVSAIT
jgi:hypothetical protein